MKALTAAGSALVLAVFLLSVAPGAQAPTAQPGQVQSATIAANGDTGQFSLYQATGGAIQFSGTFVGTVQFEATINGTTWNALSVTPTAGGAAVTSATATGAWTFSNPGYSNVRVRASAWTSGNLIAQVTTTGPGVTTASGAFADGTASAPSVTFASEAGLGFFKGSSGYIGIANDNGLSTTMFTFGTTGFNMGSGTSISWGSSAGAPLALGDTVLCRGAANVIGIGGCTSSFPALARSGAAMTIALADNSARAALNVSTLNFNTSISTTALLMSLTAPTISSGFGTSPSIASNNGTSTFRINVGTGGVATSGVVGMPTAATGWNCTVQDMTNNTVTRQTASTTTSVTLTAAAAWAASDILIANCFGY